MQNIHHEDRKRRSVGSSLVKEGAHAAFYTAKKDLERKLAVQTNSNINKDTDNLLFESEQRQVCSCVKSIIVESMSQFKSIA